MEGAGCFDDVELASMKALPKRKGNSGDDPTNWPIGSLNESPSKKEGKCHTPLVSVWNGMRLNESPSKKEGKSRSIQKQQGFLRRPQ